MGVWHRISAEFDDPNLLGVAGLVPVVALAERAGLHQLIGGHVTVPGSAGANAAEKVTAVVAGMVAGADSFADWICCGTGRWAGCSEARMLRPDGQNGDEHRAGDCPGGQRCGSQRGRGRGNEHGRSRGANDAGAVVGQEVQTETRGAVVGRGPARTAGWSAAGQRGPAAPAGDQNSQDHRQREPSESGGGDGERAAESQRAAPATARRGWDARSASRPTTGAATTWETSGSGLPTPGSASRPRNRRETPHGRSARNSRWAGPGQ